jgi:hypothetical protein
MHDAPTWNQLLDRIHTNAGLLEQLQTIVECHHLGFGDFSSVLIESDFTLPEIQELYGLLRD